jgi:hypothetical protein
MKKRYLLAVIKMPVELNEDNSIVSLMDYAETDFEECGELPPIIENQQKNVNDKLMSFLKRSDELKELKLEQYQLKEQQNKREQDRIKEMEQDRQKELDRIKNSPYLNINKDEINNNKKKSLINTFKNYNVKDKKQIYSVKNRNIFTNEPTNIIDDKSTTDENVEQVQ